MGVDKKWLIKSSDNIIGPVEFDFVVNNIFNGEIHLLDEIKGPFERWRPIKDHSLFAAAIEKLKASTYQSRGEHTMTATVDLHTKTDQLTQTVSEFDNDTGTLTPAAPLDTKHQEEEYKENVFRPAEAPHYSHPLERQDKPKGSSPLVFLLAFLMIVGGGAAYLVYDFNQSKLVEQKISAFDQLTDAGMKNLKIGEYEKALKNFSQAYNISPKDSNLLIEMSPLAVQFGGQFYQVQTNIENMLAHNRQKTINKIGHNIVGLSYSYRGKYVEALASYDESLAFDKDFMPAQLNKSFALIKLGKYEQAFSLMRGVVGYNRDKAIAHYFYLRTLLELGLQKNDPVVLNEVLSVADQFSQRFYDFKQEVAFLVAVAQSHLQKDPKETLESVKNFLKIDFELTNLHVHDSLIDFQSFNWIDFIPHCKNVTTSLGEYERKLVDAFCLLKIRRTIEAKNLFEELLLQNSRDGILQALYASSLLKLDELSQAKNSLGLLPQLDQETPLVETILRGCLVSLDSNCGRTIFKSESSKRLSLLYSHWGNAVINENNNIGEARSSIREGLKISPNFTPLLKLQRDL